MKHKIKIITSTNSEGKKALFVESMPLKDQLKLYPQIKSKKYQINLRLIDGSKKYMYADDEKFCSQICKDEFIIVK